MRLGESIPASFFGIPKIVVDHLEGSPRCTPFLRTRPKSLQEFLKLPRRDTLSSATRAFLAQALPEKQKHFGGSARSIENAARLGKSGVFAVVTGQQPGFLLGPMFTLLKAATAVRLARDLESAGLPCVPVFWNHAEDHDLEETNRIVLPNANAELQKFRLPYPTEKKFLSDVRLDEKAIAVFEAALATLPRTEFLTQLDELFRPRIGNSLAEETTRSLLALFGQDGLVVVEPDWLRPVSHKPLAALLKLERPFEELLEAQRKKLREAGYEPVIAQDQALLFERVGEKRQRIEPQRELAAAIEREPMRFSPGALLRPLTQCAALPLACYVGGPAEIAYGAENTPLFEALGMEPPILLPRFSATFVEPSIASALERLQIELRDALVSYDALLAKLPKILTQSAETLENMKSQLARDLKALEPEIRAIDASLLGPLEKTSASATSHLESLREKIVRAAQNKAGTGERQAKKIATTLFPAGKAQERTISPLHFFARHGTRFVDELLSTLDPFETKHCFVRLGEG